MNDLLLTRIPISFIMLAISLFLLKSNEGKHPWLWGYVTGMLIMAMYNLQKGKNMNDKPKKQPRKHQFNFRITEEEYLSIFKQSQDEGLSMAQTLMKAFNVYIDIIG